MKYALLLSAMLLGMLVGCHSHDASGNHVHDANGNHVAPENPGLEPLAFTLYSNQTELFVEFTPLIVGKECRFAAHFTILGELFKPIEKGSVTLTLTKGSATQSITAEAPEVPGIFRLRLTPQTAGESYKLVFDIKTPAFTDQITIPDVKVYPDEKAALTDQAAPEASGNNITYLKEQAWKVEFANAPAKVEPFSEVIKTSGQILAAPDDETIVVAQISGVVSFAVPNLVSGSQVVPGKVLFAVKRNEAVQSDLGTAVVQAEKDLATAQKQYERALELVKDNIVSQKEFLESQLRYEQAKSTLANVQVSQSFGQKMQKIQAPFQGFLSRLWVENGAYVQAGQPLATIAKGKKLLLRADVSQKYFAQTASLKAANFKTVGNNQVFSTKQLNGRVVSVGKTATAGSPFLPIYFECTNPGNFVPGSVAEVYLLSDVRPALIIPNSALLEEQGVFYAYVQVEGESFQKRELKLGASDGVHTEVLSGIAAGERVVTKGAYQIKLSTASGTMPAHGHEH